jgi:2-dehydro-3-deoxyphosphogluconate aldolase/(4S)-4-hydroxy-2-oxoglutarate aldolase
MDVRRSPVSDRIREERLIVVLRRIEPAERLTDLVDELVDAGVRVLEITMDGTDAAAAIAACRRRLPDDCLVGAGTVRTAAHLRAAIGAGADFGVSPILDRALLSAAGDAGLPFVAGAYSPTEVAAAWEAGAAFVKLFPASSLGPSHVRELRGPLPEVELIPTGGIDAGNAAAFLAAGAVAVGIGSAMTAADAAGQGAILDAVRGAP